MIERQLEDVSEAEQEVLTAASVVGAEFSAAAVAAAPGQTAEHVEARCETMARRGQFLHPEGTAAWPDGGRSQHAIAFGYALYHEVLYERVSASGYAGTARSASPGWKRAMVRRRTTWLPSSPCILSGDARCCGRSSTSGKLPRMRCTVCESRSDASSHHGTGVAQDPATHGGLFQHELAMRIALGPALLAIKGYGALEVAHTYTRAHALCQQVETHSNAAGSCGACGLFPRCGRSTRRHGTWGHNCSPRPNTRQTRPCRPPDMWYAGSRTFFLGAFSACAHLAQAVTLSTPQQHQATITLFGMDLGVFGRSWFSHVLWHLGYPDQPSR